jgi:hypothetical protein
MTKEVSAVEIDLKQNLLEREQRLVEKEKLLTERQAKQDTYRKMLDEKEQELKRRENSFEKANLESEWGSLVDAQAKLYQTERLTSSALDERELKLEIKKQKVKRIIGLLQAQQDDINRGIFYPSCYHCGRS